jgi:hypothetical protein
LVALTPGTRLFIQTTSLRGEGNGGERRRMAAGAASYNDNVSFVTDRGFS